MKQFLLFALFNLVVSSFKAQTQGIAYTAAGKGVATTFVTDYHALGINVSALGWGTGYEKKKTTIGLTEFGMGFYSDALTVAKLKRLYKSVSQQAFGTNKEKFDWAAQGTAAADYAEKGINLFVDYNWLGFAYQSEKFGGIAVNVRESYQWYSKFNSQISDLVFKGRASSLFDSLKIVIGNDTSVIANRSDIAFDTLNNVISGSVNVPLRLSQLTKGTSVRMSWNRYYNIGYGRKIIGNDSTFAIYAGIGGRFIQSVAMFDLESTDEGLFMYSSLSSNFDVNYGAIANSNPSNYTSTSNFLPKSVGNGYGMDFAVSVKLFGKLKISAAVNNVGSVTYNRNVYKVSDTLMTSFSLKGISDFNITESVKRMVSDQGLLKLVGQQKYTLKNAANFRAGASFDFGKIASIGIDFVMPFDKEAPGSYQNAIFSVGGEIKPVKWLAISAGYIGGGIYKHNIPLGINFILKDGAYEFGVSSYDALSFFMDKSNSVSLAFGVARMRF